MQTAAAAHLLSARLAIGHVLTRVANAPDHTPLPEAGKALLQKVIKPHRKMTHQPRKIIPGHRKMTHRHEKIVPRHPEVTARHRGVTFNT